MKIFKNKLFITFSISFLAGLLLLVIEVLYKSLINWTGIIKHISDFFLFELNVPIWKIVLFLLVLWILLFFLRKTLSKRTKYTNKQKTVMEYKNQDFPDKNIQAKWTVFFNKNGEPEINDLRFLCTAHEFPLKIVKQYDGRLWGAEWYKCLRAECKTEFSEDTYDQIKNTIESMLLELLNE